MATQTQSRSLGSNNVDADQSLSSLPSFGVKQGESKKLPKPFRTSKRVGNTGRLLVRQLSQQYKAYTKAVHDSGGFAVPYFPELKDHIITCGFETGVVDRMEARSFVIKAIDHYMSNVDKYADLKFGKVEKINFEIDGSSWKYYLTFQATDFADDYKFKTYQALICKDIDDIYVKSCRLKLTTAA